jgi:hypothetical protein
MDLSEQLYQKTVDQLRPLATMVGPHSVTRKDDLVRHIYKALLNPASLKELWSRLDPLSQKAIGSAYHNGGEFHADGFVAQYGSLPARPKRNAWSWSTEPILLDLFFFEGHLATDLMPLLADLVPPPEKFQVIGLKNQPTPLGPDGRPLELLRADTEQSGLHDLIVYLRLVDQGQIKISSTTSRATLGGIKKILQSLMDGDLFPLEENFRATDTIRPFGLDVFAQDAKLASKERGGNGLRLSKLGQEFYQTQAPELLLGAFETWSESGSFDELSRIAALKGLRAKGTRLTAPGSRREQVIEALSWCPTGVWIDLEDFYRAVKIWHFDFEVETTYYSNLYVGYQDYGGLHGGSYWRLTKALYINAILMEYLAAIGAVDLLYVEPEVADFETDLDYYDDEFLSAYDGLKYFRINNLGAYLLGQAGEYQPARPELPPLFSLSADHTFTLTAAANLTPNDQFFLEQLAVMQKGGRYHLSTQRLLTSLEEGANLAQLTEFLNTRHAGPLLPSVIDWLAQVEQNAEAFKLSGQALLIKVQSIELAELALEDAVLRKYCEQIGPKALVVPTNREKQFRTRLKELGYILG